MVPDGKLDKQAIEDAFDAIAVLASERGLILDMAVYGGSCLVLASNIREASEDVDAVYLNHREQAARIVDTVTRRKNLPQGWLNQAARQFAPPRGNPEPHLLEFRDYPRSGSAPGLRIFTPTPEYLLAMKVLANRAPDDDKNLTDTTDAVALMKITGIDSFDKIVALMEQCYPQVPGVVPALSPRMRAKIESLVDEYNNTDTTSPAWFAGRGSPLTS
jgi:hypothetical protein